MSYELRPLNERGIGAEIVGLDLRQPASATVKASLNAALARHRVLAFREQQLSAEQFLRAGSIFGPIMSHHRKSGRTEEHAGVFEIRNKVVAPGKHVVQGDSFHTDHSNAPVPPKATALHALSLPSKGGDTQFVDMHAAYRDLPEATRRRIANLRAVHVYQSRYSPRALPVLEKESLEALPPPAVHALVRIHPDNGQPFLYLNPVRIESIVGLDDADAQALLRELMSHSTQAKYEYRHRWLRGDMVIWDNRSVMHQANGDYDPGETRRLYRLMVEGALHPGEAGGRAHAAVPA